MSKTSQEIQLARFAEQVGNFIQYWGFKKIHGQIWTYIFLSPEPLSAIQLIERLKVSKALISLAMADLIEYKLVFQTEESLKQKNKFFRANSNVFEAIRFVLETREMHLINTVSSEFKLLKNMQKSAKSSMIDDARLKSLGSMIDGAEGALANLMRLSMINPHFFLALNSMLK